MSKFVRDRNPQTSEQVPISSAALAPPVPAHPSARTPAPACGSTGTPTAPAAQPEIRVRCLLQIPARTQTFAGYEKPRPAPASADEFPAVQDVRLRGLREERSTRAVCGHPNDRTSPASARLRPHRKKNFPTTHPPATRRDVPLHGLAESELLRRSHGQQARRRRDSQRRQHSFAVPCGKPAAPGRRQLSAAAQIAHPNPRDSAVWCRGPCLRLQEKTIVRNRAAQRGRKPLATRNALATRDHPMLPIAIWSRPSRRRSDVLFRSGRRLFPAASAQRARLRAVRATPVRSGSWPRRE